MTSDPIATLRASHERLRAVATPLTPDQVRQPGYPSEWSIAQVLSHLGSGAEIGSLVLDAGLAGTGAPSNDAYPPIWDVWNAKTSDEQAADALTADAAYLARIEKIAAERPDAIFSTWFGEVNIVGVATMRLFEHAVHTWDVVVAVQPDAAIMADAVPIILTGLGRYIGFSAKPNGRTDRIRLTTTEPDADTLLVLGEPSTWEPWAGGDATAHVRLPGEALVRLVYGRLDPAHTPSSVQSEGIDLDELRAVFPGF